MSTDYSILIPTLNEEFYIKDCILSLVEKNDLINNCEILIIDGGSKDKTLEIIEQLKTKYKNIHILHNSKKITPCALNIGINASKGKYIIRLDAHAEYCQNYIDKTINYLDKSDSTVFNIGGYIETKSKKNSLLAVSISKVLSSVFGVGNSSFRTQKPTKPLYVDTVPFGGFKKEAFLKLGLFDETEPRNEDLEFNNRIRNAGYKIVMQPDLSSIYYSRNDLKSFLNQSFDNGYIVTKNIIRGKIFHNIRHYVPLVFSIFIITTIFTTLFLRDTALQDYLNFILIIYISLNLLFTIINSIASSRVLLLFIMPFIYFILHVTYGLGSLFGLSNLTSYFKLKNKF